MGSLEAGRSPVGAWDMAGNVWEWTSGYHSDTGYLGWDTVDPQGPVWDDYKVVRGGGESSNTSALPTYNRWGREAEYGSGSVGFRCADGPS